MPPRKQGRARAQQPALSDDDEELGGLGEDCDGDLVTSNGGKMDADELRSFMSGLGLPTAGGPAAASGFDDRDFRLQPAKKRCGAGPSRARRRRLPPPSRACDPPPLTPLALQSCC